MTKLAAYTGEELSAEPDPFAKVRQLGFRCIEIAGMSLPLPHHQADLAKWSDQFESLGLEPRFHCSPKTNSAFFNSDEAARSLSLSQTARDLKAAARIGIRSVVIHPSAAVSSEDGQRVINALCCLQEQAARLDIQLELECASGPFNGDPGKLASLCKAVPGVGIALDVGHAFRSLFCLEGTGTLAKWIEIASPWVKSIQFNDVKREDERFVQTAVGQGDVPYKDVMSSLIALNCPWWTIELASIDGLMQSRAYLEQFLQ